MSDVAGVNLKEPDKMDWENYNPGSKFVAPPPALGPDGKAIVYFAQAPDAFTYKDFLGATEDGYRTFLIDPLTIVRSGNGADGYKLRFTRVSVRKFLNKRTGEPVNASTAGNYLRAAGILAKPQRNQ